MKVWITQYALTNGIEEMEAEQCDNAKMVEVRGEYTGYYHGEGKNWHRTKEGAIKRAEDMRVMKIVSLKRSIAKLEALKFQ